jgi:glutathione S-transferase
LTSDSALQGFVPLIAQVTTHMTPRNVEAFTSVLQDFTGSATIPQLTEEHINAVRSGLSQLVKHYHGRKYLLGDKLSYSDFLLGSFIVTLNEVLDERRKTELRGWDNGKWGEMLLEYEEMGYMKTDEGELFQG